MYYTVSKKLMSLIPFLNETQTLQNLFPDDAKIVLNYPTFVVFTSDVGWDTVRKCFDGFTAVGLWRGERELKPNEVVEEKKVCTFQNDSDAPPLR